MTPISRPEWNVPLQVHELAPKTIPFCHDCIDLAQDHLAMLPSPPVPNITRPADPPTSAGASPQPSAKPPRSKGPATVDDLMA